MSKKQDRITRAAAALSTYRELAGGWGPEEESITDLLADLMHLVDELLLQWPEQRLAYGRGVVLGPVRA